MIKIPILSLMIFLPLIGSFFILMIKQDDNETVIRNSRIVALVTSITNVCISFIVFYKFDPLILEFQFFENLVWIKALNVNYCVGVDGISLPFILITTVLVFIAILVSWQYVQDHIKEYLIAFLVLETMILGMFLSVDLFLFYVFYEGIFIPMFLIINIWGRYSKFIPSFKFFIYISLSSILLLVAILIMYSMTGSTNILDIIKHNFTFLLQILLWIILFISFFLKSLMWPLYKWIFDISYKSLIPVSIIFVSLLLNVWCYGILRFLFSLFPVVSAFLAWFVYIFSVIIILYGLISIITKNNLRIIISYLSIIYVSLINLGLFSFSLEGIQGGIILAISSSLLLSALSICCGIIYDRYSTYNILKIGRIIDHMPNYVFIFTFFILSIIAFPGTSNFIGQILILIGIYKVSGWLFVFILFLIIATFISVLIVYKNIVFDRVCKDEESFLAMDLVFIEKVILIPLIFLILCIGFYPKPLLNKMKLTTTLLVEKYSFIYKNR